MGATASGPSTAYRTTTTTSDDSGPHTTGGWSPIPADKVRRRTFRRTPIGRRGYQPDDVDRYLGDVADEIERWSSAYAAAVDENHRLRNYFRAHGFNPAGPRADEPSGEAATVLAHARAHADRVLADARAQAEAMQAQARARAHALVAHARASLRAAISAVATQLDDNVQSPTADGLAEDVHRGNGHGGDTYIGRATPASTAWPSSAGATADLTDRRHPFPTALPSVANRHSETPAWGRRQRVSGLRALLVWDDRRGSRTPPNRLLSDSANAPCPNFLIHTNVQPVLKRMIEAI